MESSILSEVDDTSILRTELPRRYACPLNWLPASRLLPRAAGWSAATLCLGQNRRCRQRLSTAGLPSTAEELLPCQAVPKWQSPRTGNSTSNRDPIQTALSRGCCPENG